MALCPAVPVHVDSIFCEVTLMCNRSQATRSFAGCFTLAILTASLAGCALGTAAPPGDGFGPEPVSVMSGQARGGYAALSGSFADLYQSTTNGYSGIGAFITHNLPQADGGTTAPDGENLTGKNGEFSFQTGKPCTPGAILYVVISGGSGGGTSTNNQVLETAPIGLCGTGGLTTGSFTYVNELSTVATAYALGSFINIDSSNAPAVGPMTSGYIVNISAPANNAAAPVSGAAVPNSGACTNGATYIATGSNNVSNGTVCSASGLTHAYNNVANLVNVTANPMTAYAVPPSNSSGAVPQALINTIANILQNCVSSNGLTLASGLSPVYFTQVDQATLSYVPLGPSDYFTGTLNFIINGTPTTVPASSTTVAQLQTAINANTTLSTAGVTATWDGTTLTIAAPSTSTLTGSATMNDSESDGTVCGKLMALALPIDLSGAPANTLQAVMNLAKNPYISSANVAALYALTTAQPAYRPTLTVAPPDWTIAVSYPAPLPSLSGVSQSAGFAFTPNLDADDNVYVAADASDPLGTIGSVACIDAFSANGTLLSGNLGYGCNAISSASAYLDVVPDALGNLWTTNTNNGTSLAGHMVLQFSASSGSLRNTYAPANTTGTGRLWAIAADKLNDVDFTLADNNVNNIQTLQNSSGTWTPAIFNGGATTNGAAREIALDASGNVWDASYGANASSFGGALGVIPSISSAPAYNTNNFGIQSAPVAGGTVATNTNANSGPNGLAVDANSNVWVSNIGLGTYSGAIGVSEGVPPTAYPIGNPATMSMPFTNATNTGLIQPKYMQVDGANNLWMADTNGYHEFNLTNNKEISQTGGFEPCYLGAAGTATTCTASYDASSRGIAVDSAGTVWTVYSDWKNSSSKSQGRLFQIIGSGFPVWPLKAQQQPGIPAGCVTKLVNGQCSSSSAPQTINVNLADYAADCIGHSQSSVCIESFIDAITVAVSTVARDGNTTYNINIPAGTYDFSDEGPANSVDYTFLDNQGNPIYNGQGVVATAVMDVSGLAPSGSGSLNILGAGSANTTLIFNPHDTQINGLGISHVHFGGWTSRLSQPTTTQGTVTASGPGYVTITIPPNFPTVDKLYDGTNNSGRFIRVYDNSNPLNPTMNLDPSNSQISWGWNPTTNTPIPPVCTGNSCTLYYNNPSNTQSSIATQPNQIVCVKSEGFGGQAYFFDNRGSFEGTDVGFNDIVWEGKSRGVWYNFTHEYVTNSAIIRRPPPGNGTQAFCLSTAGGGPQFSQTDSADPAYVYVNNFSSEASGDDSLAIFNDTSSTSIFSNTNIGELINNVGWGCSYGCVTNTTPKQCTVP